MVGVWWVNIKERLDQVHFKIVLVQRQMQLNMPDFVVFF